MFDSRRNNCLRKRLLRLLKTVSSQLTWLVYAG